MSTFNKTDEPKQQLPEAIDSNEDPSRFDESSSKTNPNSSKSNEDGIPEKSKSEEEPSEKSDEQSAKNAIAIISNNDVIEKVDIMDVNENGENKTKKLPKRRRNFRQTFRKRFRMLPGS